MIKAFVVAQRCHGMTHDNTHRNIKGNMVGDKDFQRVINSYVNGSLIDKGNLD